MVLVLNQFFYLNIKCSLLDDYLIDKTTTQKQLTKINQSQSQITK